MDKRPPRHRPAAAPNSLHTLAPTGPQPAPRPAPPAQDAHRIDEHPETGERDYVYTNQRSFKERLAVV